MTTRTVLCVLIGMMWPVAALADPVRIAVISDGDSHDLATLVTTEISGNPALKLLERDDLAQIGDELKLQQMAGSDAVALGKLIGADGLLFIDKSPGGLQVRFTAVGLGYALFDDETASPVNLPQLAKSLAHRVEDYDSKLKLKPDQLTPISVLNLRADYATSDSTVLERKLTLLLESRLASLPQYVVLERRHAWSLGFERSLNTTNPSLLHGAYLIDGTLSIPTQGTVNMTVHLRLRTSNGQEINSTVEGLPNDLPGLVEKMTADITQTAGGVAAPTVGPQENEAHEYFAEGIWGERNNADEAALEAFDSAELLGENVAKVTTFRIFALSHLVQKGQSLNTNIDYAIRAAHDFTRYREEDFDTQLKNLRSTDPELKNNYPNIYYAASALYPIYDLQCGLDEAHASRAEELRKAVRSAIVFDPLHGQAAWVLLNRNVTQYIDCWSENLEEELAYYHLVCTDKEDLLPEWIADNPGSYFCPRFIKTPEERQKAFDQFVESLKAQPNSRMTYLIFKTHSHDPAVADSAYQDFLRELWNQREEMIAPTDKPSYRFHLDMIPKEVAARQGALGLPLIHYYLTSAKQDSSNIDILTHLWLPETFPESEAPRLWKEFSDCRQRLSSPSQGHSVYNFDPMMREMADSFTRKFPQVVGPPPSLPLSGGPSLRVTRFWYPHLSVAGASVRCHFPIMDSDEEGVWLVGGDPFGHPDLFRVNLPDFSTQMISVPGNFFPETIRATSEAVYMTGYIRAPSKAVYNWMMGDETGEHQIARYDRKTGAWATHAFPDYSFCSLYGLEDSLYLFLVSVAKTHDLTSIFARYDWNGEKLIILSSTRRRPAQNQFDDHPRNFAQLFSGPGHKPCVQTMQGAFYVEKTPGPWPEVFDDASLGSVSLTAENKTIVVNPEGEVIFIDPDQAAPEYLMASSGPIVRKMPRPGEKAVRKMASWAGQAIWDLPADKHLGPFSTAFREGRLFVLDKPSVNGGTYTLLCYEKGKGRTPQHVPLEFHLEDKALALWPEKQGVPPEASLIYRLEHPVVLEFISSGCNAQLIATKRGLCILPSNTSWAGNIGFWFLSYDDIDAYLKAHSP